MKTFKTEAILTIVGGKARVWNRAKGTRQKKMAQLVAELASVPGVRAWALPDERAPREAGRNHAEILLAEGVETFDVVVTAQELWG